ncbi:MAG: iron(III) transport system ATP-binding protein [Solirubrobacterales bacterium]|jgi:iron(III) transport system ATP-binding protein|nr:iron(III) transport system ATP-binding protein [Solirubrobacterales bacterium]
MMSPATSLSVIGLSKAFGDSPVLLDLNLEVPTGSLTAVLGPSGCGKTTLLRLLGGFEHADGGSIRLGERVLCDEGAHLAPERRAIGFVPQEGALFPHLDVAANVGFGLPRAVRRSGRVEELLQLVGLQGLAKRFPHQLSGGQQQRVALARALAPEPGLVLLDEPFDALDAGLRAQVRGEVREVLRAAGATALLVTHDQEEALSLADTVAVMRGGRIVQAADPQTLYRDPVDAEVARFVGEAVLLEGRLDGDYAETLLGRLPTRGADAADGASATVMLRPEQILCHGLGLAADAERPCGRVLSTSFYGHDATARIALDDPDCREIIARAAGHLLPQAGDEVTITVEGTALAYPARGAGQRTADERLPAFG